MQLDPITRAVLDAMQEGVLIIDAQERIVYGNRPMWPFWRRRPAGPSGRSRDTPCGCCAPVPGCRRCWLRSAPSMHTPRQESEDIYFVNMYPIFDGAEVVGGLSVVTFWKDAFDFRGGAGAL